MRNVTLKQLRALQAVAESGSVTAAAQRLHVTPPAVSLQLKLLEEHAGIALLERAPEGLRLTSAGQVVLDAIHQIEGVLKACALSLEEMKGVSGGSVRVGVVSTAKYFAPRALAAFMKEHPEIDIRLQVGNRNDTVEALANYDLDFAIMGRPPDTFEVSRSIIGPHPHVLVCPPDHPLAGRNDLRPADLAHETFLMREKGSGTRTLTEKLIARLDIEPKIGMEIGSNETIKQAVMAGLGIALISAHTVATELRDGRLGLLRLPGLPLMRQWYVVRRKEKRLMPAAAALWEFMAAQGAAFLPRLRDILKPAA
ncbi:LysR family transcriptional regulator [Thermopetrobacter sp. TC1]|uniref:LysR family transcriptional regulator n=1 Tax=Thermopetrobacter sp. TC1 TaxID=1495045 RepID=UPI00056E6E2E|nr:LysR family transcriptional regulator [Thermopetrobacter sp. TC1]